MLEAQQCPCVLPDEPDERAELAVLVHQLAMRFAELPLSFATVRPLPDPQGAHEAGGSELCEGFEHG